MKSLLKSKVCGKGIYIYKSGELWVWWFFFFNFSVPEVPTLFYIQAFKFQGKSQVIEEWKSNLFQIPPSTISSSENEIHFETTKEQCGTGNQGSCQNFCHQNKFKQMIYDQEEKNCFIFENEIDISSAKNWMDGYKTYQNYISNYETEEEWHFNCSDIPIPSTISSSTTGSGTTGTSVTGSSTTKIITTELSTSNSDNETTTEAKVDPNENEKIKYIGIRL